jgi:membrane protein
MQIPGRFDLPRWLSGLLLTGLIVAAWRVESKTPVPARNTLGKTSGHRRVAVESPALIGSASRVPSSWREWKDILWQVYEAMSDDRLLAVAAGIVFYGLLALFPAITAFVSFYGLFAKASTINDHLSLVAGIVPAGAFDIVREQVGRILAKGDSTLGFAFIFGTLFALWSANAGMKAMMDALNVIYGVRETRGFFRLNAVSLALTFGAIAMLLLAVGGVVVFPLLMSSFGFDGLTESAAPLLRWPLLLVGLLLALAVLYRFGPSPHGAKWRWITPGAVFATFSWLLGSALLSWYLANFANYDATYGSLGAAMGMMMWMWMSSIVVLLGAQLNVVLDKRAERAAGQPSSEPLPIGNT